MLSRAFVPLLVAADTNAPPAEVSAALDEASRTDGRPVRAARPRAWAKRWLRVGAPAAEETLLPPTFDSRLWYRRAHEPYTIEDQGDCASCVFIAASVVAKVRGGIQKMTGSDGGSAAAAWRQILGEHAGDYAAATKAFEQQMAARARNQRRTEAPIGLLDWRAFVCCDDTVCQPEVVRDPPCYHHLDGDPAEAAFSCGNHVEGVVPHHFIEWVAKDVGFRRRRAAEHDPPGPLVIRTLRPEARKVQPRFSLVEPVHVLRVDDAAARAVARQVRRIKTSLMANGPVMAMIRIDGNSFDVWGTLRREPAAAEDGSRSSERSEGAQGGEKGGAEKAEEANMVREAYRLPGPDLFDEYHEIVVVGWTTDDRGKPCWIVQNSYGEMSNDACVPGPDAASLDLRAAYVDAGLTGKRGCVFVEMVNAELVAKRRNTDLENNVISFLPVSAKNEWTLPDEQAGAQRRADVRSLWRSQPMAFATDEAETVPEDQDGWMAYVVLAMVVLVFVLLAWRGRGSLAGPPTPT